VGARTGPAVTRRALLSAAAALPLAACTSDPEPPPPPDPDDLLRESAVERERSLLAEYDAVLLVLPSLAERLLALRAEHVEHLATLTGEGPAGTPSPQASQPGVAAVPPTATAAAALAGLVEAERAAGAAHGAATLAARSRELAALLATLSASESSHPVALA
jgi:hypothetical protein